MCDDGQYPFHVQIVTLFPEAFPGVLGLSLTGRALREGRWGLTCYDLRHHGVGKHYNVDDTPAGGGAGMVLRADVLDSAIGQAKADHPGLPIFALSPRGKPFTQAKAQRLSDGPGMMLICGRFEGYDQRVLEHHKIEEISVGDFVMTGGEIAAQALIDATVRLIPQVVGNQASLAEESFSAGLLEHPQYTRPSQWQGYDIPEVLLSGNHAEIAKWRKAQAERLTKERRPDLWRAYMATYENPIGDQERSELNNTPEENSGQQKE